MTISQATRRLGVLGVHSLDHFSLIVPDLAVAQAFYRNFGLDARVEGDELALYNFGDTHRWAAMTEGKTKRLARLSFGIFEDDLPQFRARLSQLGLPLLPAPDGGNSIWFQDMDGNQVELRVAEKSSANEKTGFAMSSSPAGVPGAMLRSQIRPILPRRMSHVAIFTRDVGKAIEFYANVLGMRLSDRSGGGVAFLHGPHGSDHHMLALVASDAPGFHHCSWDVGSVNDVGLGAQQMADKGFAAGWGLGRHVLGSNYFFYVRDPWGSYSEYSADMDYIPADKDWQAGDHDVADAMYLWAPKPPEDFITNFEAR